MPRIEVDQPDDLQQATDAYLAELIADVGEPSEVEVLHARQFVRRMGTSS